MGIFSPFRMKQMTAPPTPAAGESLLYFKSDGLLYQKGPDGIERTLVIGGAASEVGDIGATAAAAVPSGCLIADGAAVSRTTYSELFAKIGTLYGAGDGSTTFNIPDLRGRAPIGLAAVNAFTNAAGASIFDNLGEAGGSTKHSLTANELPDHYHAMPQAGAGGPGSYPDQPYRGNGAVDPNFRNSDPKIYTTGANNNYGSAAIGNQPHNNLQPYLVLTFYIRAAQTKSYVIGDDTGWITPTFQNSWVDYGGFYPCQYRRVNGIVYLRGLIKNGSTGAVPAFTLPVGFRPTGFSIFNTRTDGNPGSAYLEIRNDNGWVQVVQAFSNAWVSIESSFPAADPPVAFVSAGDVTVKMETQGAVTHARNLVSGLTSSPSSLRYMRINTTMRLDAGLMPRFRIVGKTNAYEGAFDGHLTIYLYNTGGGTLYSPRWKVFGVAPSSGCWVGKDASNQLVIILDNPAGWNYAEVTVAEVANTYGTMTRPQTEGWTVSNTADTAGLSAIVQAT